MQFKDYYQTLGVAKTATADEIKSAFRKLARTHHPDMVKPKERAAAAERFKEINEAYEVLGDPEKRRQYDELGSDWASGGAQARRHPGWQQRQAGAGPQDFEFNFGGTGFSDFFEAFFGSAGRGGREGHMGGRPQRRSVDVEADLMVTLEEALHGAKRKITFQREGGKPQSYNVAIPAGVRSGQRIRLGGQGEGGGDLYLNVRFAPHPDFAVDGADLVYELALPPWRLVLGGEATVPTMEGHAKLKLPPGSQPTQRFRLKGRGLAKEGGKTRGDLYVAVVVEIPKTLSAEQRKHWEALAEE